eukprot:CAMPEP_0183772880 /NCGR_PEP_ID=MMETSP0739-20130205/37388_1 /TAXON_ID=385413 /ORGANISM="Thalassiosira miniscula, Strain CCMP1093" /LENGTH=152 /DNA_ID=CAMNT_0026013701 /DNA_START=97 /DNA_END=555 /DNA_ORIENTATION=+
MNQASSSSTSIQNNILDDAPCIDRDDFPLVLQHPIESEGNPETNSLDGNHVFKFRLQPRPMPSYCSQDEQAISSSVDTSHQALTIENETTNRSARSRSIIKHMISLTPQQQESFIMLTPPRIRLMPSPRRAAGNSRRKIAISNPTSKFFELI